MEHIGAHQTAILEIKEIKLFEKKRWGNVLCNHLKIKVWSANTFYTYKRKFRFFSKPTSSFFFVKEQFSEN